MKMFRFTIMNFKPIKLVISLIVKQTLSDKVIQDSEDLSK